MTNSSLVLVLSSVLLLGLVVPTAASSGDQLWTEPAVVLEPGSGPGGQYASLDADGELAVDLSDPGVNAGAVTVVDGVFTVRNEDETAVAIWFSHDEPDDVVLSVDGESAQHEDNPVVLAAGEQASVDLSIDSSDRAAGDVVLSSFTINAEDATEAGSDGGGSSTGSTGSSGDSAGSGSEPTNASDDSTPSAPPPSGADEVLFADGRDPAVTITALNPATVATLDDRAGVDGPPRPAINAVAAPRTLDGEGAARPVDGADGLVRVGDPLALSAERTVFGSAAAIQPDGRPARLVDVDVPSHRTGEPAIVRLAVGRERFDGADPTDTRIGRHTADGWQLLATTVVEADDERVVLQAHTPAVTRFAVFADPSVRYAWQLPDGETADTLTAAARLDQPGRHAVTLSVTDGLGRAATAEYRMLANDRPAVAIETPASIAPGESVVLQADVTDAVGETTVTWQFADGSTAVGPSVERSFPAGEHEVRVAVTDEYGETVTTSRVLAVGGVARATQAAVELARLGLAIEDRLLVTAVTVGLLVAAIRRWAARPRRTRARRVR